MVRTLSRVDASPAMLATVPLVISLIEITEDRGGIQCPSQCMDHVVEGLAVPGKISFQAAAFVLPAAEGLFVNQ